MNGCERWIPKPQAVCTLMTFAGLSARSRCTSSPANRSRIPKAMVRFELDH